VTQRDQLEGSLHRLCADVVLGTRSRTRLLDRLACEDPEGDRDGQRCREVGERSRDGVGKDIEVRGLASDQAAERHDCVETAGAREHRHGRWQLEGASNFELFDLRFRAERRLDRALGECPRDLVVPARADDRHTGAAMRILSPGRSLPRGRHLPQSSPRMPHCLVSA
jgi:hypothetical protein